MDIASRAIRRDGWTSPRRRQFLESLAAGDDVRRACAGVGLSRRAAYYLRYREPAFAQAWDAAQQAARESHEQAWLTGLPESLLRTLSAMSGECELRRPIEAALDTVRCAARV